MEATEKLTGTIGEQVAAILDYRNESMWLSGVIYDGDHLDTDATVSDVLEFRGQMDIPEGMEGHRLQYEIERASREWAECNGLKPFSRAGVIEDARDSVYGAWAGLDDMDVDTLCEIVPKRDVERAVELVRQALDLLSEARCTLDGIR